MYATSQVFIDKMRAPIRDVYAKVQIDYSDPELDQSIDVFVSEGANITYPDQIADGVEDTAGRIASLDGSWVLGEYRLAPLTDLEGQMGWWSEQLSNSNRQFATPFPTASATFIHRPIRELKVIGDTQRNEWPVDFTINLYDEVETLKHSEIVTDNETVNWRMELDPVVTGITHMELVITKWSHAGRQAKITEFFTSIQETYLENDLIEINFIEEREVSHGTLPIGNISSNQIEIKLNNEKRQFDTGNQGSPLYGLVKANRKIQAWIGTDDELIPLGIFWTKDWDVPEDGVIATTTGRDRLDRLGETNYSTSTVQINKTMYDLAQMVLIDAGVPVDFYWLDEELKDYNVPYAYFETQTHRETLRKIAGACLGQVYCDRDGVIRFEGPSFTLDRLEEQMTTAFLQTEQPAEIEVLDAYGISMNDYFSKNNPSRQSDIANSIVVEVMPLTLGEEEEIYKSGEPMAIKANETQVVTIQFNHTPCIDVGINLTGNGSIVDTKIYAWGADVTVTSSSNGSYTLTANGKPLKVINKDKIIREDGDSITDNGRVEYNLPENHLIQTRSLAEIMANKLLQYYKDPQRDVEIEWRGNPALELGDIIVVDDYSRGEGEKGYYYVTKQEMEYAGYLRAKLNGRRAL